MEHEVVITDGGKIDVDTDPLSTKLLNIEELNKNAPYLLTLYGLNGGVFHKKAPRLDKSET